MLKFKVTRGKCFFSVKSENEIRKTRYAAVADVAEEQT